MQWPQRVLQILAVAAAVQIQKTLVEPLVAAV
jgi:hypothetical protein